MAKIPSSFAGKITKLHFKADEICQVGQPLLEMEVDDSVKAKEEVKKEEPAPAKAAPVETPPEVKKVIEKVSVAPTPAPVQEKIIEIPKEIINKREDKLVKLTGIRKAMGKSMTEAWTIPHYNTKESFDIAAMKKVRKVFAELYPKGKLTMIPIMVKAFSAALLQYPIFNSIVTQSKDDEGIVTEYIQKVDHNMSLAIDTPSGLLVPNLKSVQNKSVLQINEEFRQMVERGRSGKLTQEDLSDGTFTLSNIGNIGCITGTPVIFRPQVAIAAVGVIRTVPKYVDTKILPAEVIVATMSTDHRIIDGASTTKFLQCVKNYIENIESILLTMK